MSALKNVRKQRNHLVSRTKKKKHRQESLDYLTGTTSEGYRYAIRETDHVRNQKNRLRQEKHGILNLDVKE